MSEECAWKTGGERLRLKQRRVLSKTGRVREHPPHTRLAGSSNEPMRMKGFKLYLLNGRCCLGYESDAVGHFVG